MIADEAAIERERLLTERAALRTMTIRRRRVWRNVAVFLLVTAGMVLVVMAKRDAQSVSACRSHLEYSADALQTMHAQGKPFPLTFPQPPGPAGVVRAHYHYNPLNVSALGNLNPVGICYCEEVHPLFLRAKGRHVLLFDGKSFELRWVADTEFRRQAAGWGFQGRFDK